MGIVLGAWDSVMNKTKTELMNFTFQLKDKGYANEHNEQVKYPPV